MAGASRAGGGLRQAWRCGIERAPSVASPDRAIALSLQLAQAHHELRRRLRTLKSDLGRRAPSSGASGASGASEDDDGLVTHCLAFCAAITAHHQGEDAGMFA